MISGYHLSVAEHYERFPYPAYPLFAAARWEDLKSVDTSTWGLDRPAKEIWVAGCGTIAPLMFARRNIGARILATDLSSQSLKILKRRLQLYGMHNVLLKTEDIMESKYSEAFDAIDCYGVLHHTVSPKLALEKLAMALKPGGILRLMVYSTHAREEIEKLRAEMLQRKANTIELVWSALKELRVSLRGDLGNRVGVADALLNPIVHVFSADQINELVASVPSLEVCNFDCMGNFVLFLKKIDPTRQDDEIV